MAIEILTSTNTKVKVFEKVYQLGLVRGQQLSLIVRRWCSRRKPLKVLTVKFLDKE